MICKQWADGTQLLRGSHALPRSQMRLCRHRLAKDR
jgi:hypothetical protein